MTKNDTLFLVIDAGNTAIKTALFKNLILIEQKRFENLPDLFNYTTHCTYQKAILSSVLNEEESQQIIKAIPNLISVNECTIPLDINYQSKESLGNDRLANAVYAANQSKNNNVLVIDIGTCIKFDMVLKNGQYIGGSISPGIDLRYKSMHYFTGKLPELSLKEKIGLIGNNTKDCMHSGVINGIMGEIQYFIAYYEQQFPDLTIFVTGGDQIYFDISSKKTIFALENLTLYGLNLILQANVH
ncbi:MAG: type III pantothenate kinase [Flavobacteriia bacterium]|nr:type III pantothenate kinase [Flavobacteriia bacterium]